jgi:hypothetical protein
VGHCQNGLSGLGNLHCARCTGPEKTGRVLFTEVSTVEFFPGMEPMNDNYTLDAQEQRKHGFRAAVVRATLIGPLSTNRHYIDR